MVDVQRIRDERVPAHALALTLVDGHADLLFETNLESSRFVGDMLAFENMEQYDVSRTRNYIHAMTLSQIGANTDGLGSATGAVMFGVRSFAQQSRKTWQLVWHHTTRGSAAREEHVHMDGQTADPNTGFDVSPGLGAPSCACWISLEPAY